MKKRIKINGFIIFLTVCLLAVFPDTFFRQPDDLRLDIIISVVGLLLIILGQFLRISARGYKSENSLQGHALLKDGPYALSRNPMYLGILCIGLGIVSVLFQWWVAAVFLAIFCIRYIPLILSEEKKLSALFPQSYALYRNKTARLFPQLNAIFVPKNFPLKIKWIKRELNSVLPVLLAVVAVKIYFLLKT